MARSGTPESPVFYVYIYYRLDGMPCYVGKGRGARWGHHLTRPNSNAHLRSIIKQSGGNLPRRKIVEGLTEPDAFAWERELIAEIGREAHGGPLVNLTDGGEGHCGLRQSEETKIKRANSIRGKKRTAETRSRMSDAQKEVSKRIDRTGVNNPFFGKSHKEDTKRKIVEKQRLTILEKNGGRGFTFGRKTSDETKAKQRLAALNRAKVSDATREKLRQSALVQWQRYHQT